MTTSLDFTLESRRVSTKSGTAKQEAFLLGEVTKGRERERVLGIDGPRDLARVERAS